MDTSWQVTVGTTDDGWLLVPRGLSAGELSQWRDDALEGIFTLWGDGWDRVARARAAASLDHAIKVRQASAAIYVFQVWHAMAPVAPLCRIIVTRSEGAPSWSELAGRTYAVTAPNIGPGVQYTSQRVLHDGNGVAHEVASSVFTFDDGETMLIIATDEIDPLFLVHMWAGLSGLVENISMESADGAPFRSVQSEEVPADDQWEMGGSNGK